MQGGKEISRRLDQIAGRAEVDRACSACRNVRSEGEQSLAGIGTLYVEPQRRARGVMRCELTWRARRIRRCHRAPQRHLENRLDRLRGDRAGAPQRRLLPARIDDGGFEAVCRWAAVEDQRNALVKIGVYVRSLRGTQTPG